MALSVAEAAAALCPCVSCVQQAAATSATQGGLGQGLCKMGQQEEDAQRNTAHHTRGPLCLIQWTHVCV